MEKDEKKIEYIKVFWEDRQEVLFKNFRKVWKTVFKREYYMFYYKGVLWK